MKKGKRRKGDQHASTERRRGARRRMWPAITVSKRLWDLLSHFTVMTYDGCAYLGLDRSSLHGDGFYQHVREAVVRDRPASRWPPLFMLLYCRNHYRVTTELTEMLSGDE